MQERALSGSRAALLLAAALLGCNREKVAPAPCVGEDAACGGACSLIHPCPSGLYCNAQQLCAMACDSAHPCRDGGECTSSGECKPGRGAQIAQRDAGSDAGSPDGGQSLFPDSGTSSTKPQDVSSNDISPDGEVCARTDVVAGRVIPTVILIIDESISMDEMLGTGGTRWNVLRDFLLADTGLIKSLQDRMRFGLSMYSAHSEPINGVMQECPLVKSVAPALNNFAAIEAAYRSAEPIDDTPTGDAIDKILTGLPQPAPDAPKDPIVFVLATDGDPDRCEQLDPQPEEAKDETIAAVTRAYGMNIKTFLIGVGADITLQHQQDVANAGIGQMAGAGNAPFWSASDDQSLRTALTEIINAQVSCDVTLKGKVSGDPCRGSVMLSGAELKCRDQDGWELIDETHLRLLGKACESFKKEQVSTLHVTFPCEAVVLD